MPRRRVVVWGNITRPCTHVLRNLLTGSQRVLAKKYTGVHLVFQLTTVLGCVCDNVSLTGILLGGVPR